MIHLNQVGYGADMPKKAVITGKGENCFVVAATIERSAPAAPAAPAASVTPTASAAPAAPTAPAAPVAPKMTEPRFDPASGDTVRVVDFSGITKPGEYFLFADGLKKTFYIKEEPYRELAGALVKGMYYQRCGCALDEKHAGLFRHAECHTGKATLVHDDSVVLDVAGGWHDAGDYGRYIAPAAVAIGHMLYAYEMFPEVYVDELNIPESGNGVPDILNECRYELDWMLKMQREDGGLYHKVATRYFAPFIMPEDDQADLLLFRVTHTSTAAFAAALAQAYRVYTPFDGAYADKLLAAAVRAWDWLEANPVFEPFENPPNVSSGAYGDDNCEDELFWAACELYAATKEGCYLDAMQKRADKVDISELGWRNVGGLGAICCLFAMKEELDAAFVKKLRERFLGAADRFYALHMRSGYGTALDIDNYIWGSILPIMNNAIALICATKLTGETSYRDAAQAQLNYLCGVNATGYSFVTGFGENAFRYPHHRPSYADGVSDPVPGLVSGGPNSKTVGRFGASLFPEGTPPAKYYLDHTPNAAVNEIAIYWNSPAIFVAAYFHSLSLK